ncbi:hypothetical protein HPB51_003890 [Rhipicephalus microplus]|uniref:Uncharacterized protein n=1 Tax=Rhipicephalus microplus TaxID=6941 RepID=A0A9J6EFZ5_RHIMP|nr:hypothetical protein HPB51_003890 [Rhipicephalus microplus]
MKHCRTFESLKMRRISPKFGRLSNVPTVASVETVPPNDLALTIRQIVREELLRCQQTYHRPSDFQDVYVNEPERVQTPVSLPPWQPSINAADAYEYQGTRQAGFPRHPTPNYERSFRRLFTQHCLPTVPLKGGTTIPCVPRGVVTLSSHVPLDQFRYATTVASRVILHVFVTTAHISDSLGTCITNMSTIHTPRHRNHAHLPGHATPRRPLIEV